MSGPGFQQHLSQRQTQQMVLAPQLRQSLKILQVAALDLRSVIQEELQSNPTLEEEPMEGESLDQPAADTPPDGENRQESERREELDFSKDFEVLTKLDDDYRFGLIEMTRQRIRPSLKRSVYKDCPGCAGSGVVKTAESMAIEVVRLLILATQYEDVAKVTITVADDVATYLNNKKRRELSRLEDENKISVQIFGLEGVSPEHLILESHDTQGRELKIPVT